MAAARTFAALFLAALLLSFGCVARREAKTALAPEIDLFDVTLYADAAPRVLQGVAATREPCLEGHEDVFEALGLRIGYTREGVVRRLVTLHPATGAYGVRVGDPLSRADEILRRRGFVPEPTRNAYRNELCRIALLVDERGRVFGLRIEGLEALL